MSPNGIIKHPSPYSVKETIDRLAVFLKEQGATIYARINQQIEVHNAGNEIKPLEFIMFGNPKTGGAIMAQNPVSALDLPLKLIAWEDDDNKVWLAYNEALYLEERYSLPHKLAEALDLGKLVTKVI
jgi:uncharacterized protein (DUF302 family)